MCRARRRCSESQQRARARTGELGRSWLHDGPHLPIQQTRVGARPSLASTQARRTRVERSDFRILSFKNRRFSRSLFLALPNELPLKNQRIGFEPTTQDVVCNRASAHRGTQQPNTPQKLLSKSEARSAVPYGCVLRGSRTHGVTSRDRTCEARARVPTLLHQKHDFDPTPKRRKPPG